MADVERLVWFRFFPSDWRGSYAVQRMTPCQRGYYVQLLAWSWDENPRGSLPINQTEVAWMAGAKDVEDFLGNGGLYVMAQFIERDGRLWHEKLEREHASALASLASAGIGGKKRMSLLNSQERTLLAKKAAFSRWNASEQANDASDYASGCQPVAGINASELQPQPPITTTTPISPKRRRNRTDILAPYPGAVGVVVNALVPKWPGKRKDGSIIKTSLPELAQRVDECLKQASMTAELLIRAAQDYIASKPDYPHAPQYFFGPGKNGTPPWAAYVRMALHKDSHATD